MRINFDLANTQAFDGRVSLLPAGDYAAIVETQKEISTKSGQGKRLEVTYRIIEGEHKGAVLREWINLHHENRDAVLVAQRQIKALCDACQKTTISDTLELNNIPFVVSIGVEEYNGKERNRVIAYSVKRSSVQSVQSVPQQQTSQPQQPFWS